jgi:hypothetical protein
MSRKPNDPNGTSATPQRQTIDPYANPGTDEDLLESIYGYDDDAQADAERWPDGYQTPEQQRAYWRGRHDADAQRAVDEATLESYTEDQRAAYWKGRRDHSETME